MRKIKISLESFIYSLTPLNLFRSKNFLDNLADAKSARMPKQLEFIIEETFEGPELILALDNNNVKHEWSGRETIQIEWTKCGPLQWHVLDTGLGWINFETSTEAIAYVEDMIAEDKVA